ncbi:MAG TPA: hypothetical protein EYQ42_04685 [Thiotrichaceae bacterium]|nr:hypothetical protein [Thiotrichaceae bacterium]
MSSALETILIAIEASTSKPARKHGSGYRALCPYHGGKHHNLSISDGDDRVLLRCHSNHCDPKNILESIGLKISDIYHQALTLAQSRNYKSIATDREIRSSLEVEIIILFQWLSASNKVLFPCDEEVSRERAMEAFKRVKNGCNHYLTEGIK